VEKDYTYTNQVAHGCSLVSIVAIAPDKIDLIWQRVKPHIDAALSYTKGELDADSIKDKLEKGEDLLLLAIEEGILASIVCEIVQTATIKVCHVVACGGVRADIWLDKWYEIIVPLAKEQGCQRISISGRKGWEKKLKVYGFNHAYTTLDQELS